MMSIKNNRDHITNFIDAILDTNTIKDYCYNGLQIQGKPNIKKLVCAVSLNLRTINKAIQEKADAILVHHGLIWGDGLKNVQGVDKIRLQHILSNDLNVYAYHLPLDFHESLGNNVLFGECIGAKNALISKTKLPIWYQEITFDLPMLLEILHNQLQRKPMVYGNNHSKIKKIGWCTGAACDAIYTAYDLGCDTFVSGESSERVHDIALELDMNFIEVGHYVSETFGVKALANKISQNFNIDYKFIDLFNHL